jgi:hypothetical protein
MEGGQLEPHCKLHFCSLASLHLPVVAAHTVAPLVSLSLTLIPNDLLGRYFRVMN